MVAGVLIGPSFLGLLAPATQNFLCPAKITTIVGSVQQTTTHPSMIILYALSQLGLVLYMFLIGLELDLTMLSRHAKSAAAISATGVLIPVFFGGALGMMLASDHRLFAFMVMPWQAGLFLASAMSITAFPMLARILNEAGMLHTRMGALLIGAAAFDDAAAWCLLACVLAVMKGSITIALLAMGGGMLYALVMIMLAKPALRWLAANAEHSGKTAIETLAPVIIVLMFCAWFTDYIGIYSVFGAFLVGIVMPRGKLSKDARQALEPLTISLLLPIFFAYSGLNTRFDILMKPALLGTAAMIIVLAFAVKFGGSFLAARMIGLKWRDASAVGTLMNARGLMELILVNGFC